MKSVLSYRPGRSENEASYKLYRGACETAQRLEHSLSQVSNFLKLFSPELTELRTRLKDLCERLMLNDPVEHGKKAEDLLWRKVYYEFFHKCKQNKKKLSESDCFQQTVQSHLLAAIGFYHHLLFRIQTEYHVDLNSKIEVPFLWQARGVKKGRWKKYQQSAEDDSAVNAWANQACHRILTYLGDLARYIAELQLDPPHEMENRHLAERYYLQAFCLNVKNGTPHNQLGSLAQTPFDSAYHYMRCLASSDRFEAAEGNLIRIFEKNSQIVEEMDSVPNDSSEMCNPARFMARFLKLCEIFYFSSDENIQKLCQDTLQDFDQCMPPKNKQTLSKPVENSRILQDEVIFKVTVMCLMCISRLHERESSDVSFASVFVLALFSSIVHFTTAMLLSAVYGTALKESDEGNGEKENKEENCSPEDQDAKETVKAKNKVNELHQAHIVKRSGGKKIGMKKFNSSSLRKLRRRRKISNTSQDDSELSDVEILELAESDEESCPLNSDGSQNGSCSSESLSECEEEDLISVEQNNLENQSKSLKESSAANVFIDTSEVFDDVSPKKSLDERDTEKAAQENVKCSEVLLPAEELVKAIGRNKLLPSVKIIMDWLKVNKQLLELCIEHFKCFFSSLPDLFNLLLKIEGHLSDCDEDFSRLQRNSSKEGWLQMFPLPEDVLLQGLPSLEKVHGHLSFTVQKRRELCLSEQVFLRLQCLLSIGDMLCLDVKSFITFDKEKRQYYSKPTRDKQVAKNSPDDLVTNDTKSQREHLMKAMGHLWLRSEVNNLEKSIHSSGSPPLSGCVVPDISALCRHLPLMKQLLATKKFIFVVPQIVIANLDQEKKKNVAAREVIRWNEYVFKKLSRFIRPQREAERCSLNPIKYPKQKDRDSCDLFQILECCYYLSQQRTADSENSKKSFVTFVYGTPNQLPGNAGALASSLNVNMQSLESFCAKWHISSKKPG